MTTPTDECPTVIEQKVPRMPPVESPPVDTFATRISRLCGRSVFKLLSQYTGNRGCLFTFHRVATTATWQYQPNRPFYLDTDFLNEIICHLVETGWSVITMDEVVDRLQTRRPGKFVNFSIDDGYRDTWELAAPIFRGLGVPLTVYVTTGIPDNIYTMWTSGLEQIIKDRDQVAVPAQGPEPHWVSIGTYHEKACLYRSLARAWEAGDPAETYRQFCVLNGCNAAHLHTNHAITWEMLRALKQDSFTELGAHTMSHPRLSSLADTDALSELAGARSRLEDELGTKIRHVAFPYGRSGDCSDRDFRLARQLGYSSASTTRRALLWPDETPDLFSLPRVNLNGAFRHVGQIATHLTGVTSLLAAKTGRN
jgi:peptidoglycan/xylan/chitin deacetylase (PgdA/CDA1 family)